MQIVVAPSLYSYHLGLLYNKCYSPNMSIYIGIILVVIDTWKLSKYQFRKFTIYYGWSLKQKSLYIFSPLYLSSLVISFFILKQLRHYVLNKKKKKLYTKKKILSMKCFMPLHRWIIDQLSTWCWPTLTFSKWLLFFIKPTTFQLNCCVDSKFEVSNFTHQMWPKL